VAYFLWSDDLSVGNEFMDSDHKMLFILVHKLYGSMVKPGRRDGFDQAIDEVIQFAKEHFEREEEEMRRVQYAGLIAHRHEHDALVQALSKSQAESRTGNAVSTAQVSRFLEEWLVRHIMVHDKLLGVAIDVAAARQGRSTEFPSLQMEKDDEFG
jgi:hemerythrin